VLDTTLPSGFRDLEEALNTGHPERLEQGSINRAMAEVAVAIEALPAEGRRRRLRLRRAARTATGQTTIEMLGMLPLILIVVLGLIQMLFVGYTWMQTSDAARAGARAWVDDSKDWWTGAAKDQLPKSWRNDTKVDELSGGGVTVTVHVPAVLPFLPSSVKERLKIEESKTSVAEE
jgi:pilus assembly protein CpaE